MFSRTRNLPSHIWVALGREVKAKNEQGRVFGNIGFLGFYAGPTIHIIDQLALTEPLLARLPATVSANWRVGHYSRTVPAGYVETTKTGTCVMEDKSLCEYYGKLREVIAGDLWSWKRFKTILGFQFGSYEYLIDRQRYRYPRLLRDSLQSLATVIPEGSPWNGPGARTLTDDGIELDIQRLSHASKIALSLDGNDTYEVEFRHGNSELDVVPLPLLDIPFMHTRELEVPKAVRAEGFDHIAIRPVMGDGLYSVGYVRLIQ